MEPTKMEADSSRVEMSSEAARKQPKENFPMKTVALAVFVSAILGGVAGSLATSSSLSESLLAKITHSESKVSAPDSKQESSITPIEPSQDVIREDEDVIRVVDQTTPAIVSIVVSKDVSTFRGFTSPFDMFFGDPFGRQQQRQNDTGETEKQKVGGGTGFFVTSDGMIVTNKHVVSDTDADYTVILNDGTEHEATVLARDPVRDIAVIKIDGNNFPTLSFGDSDSLKVGQTVIAIGNSLGEFSNSVSRGIVSGLSRDITAGSGMGESEHLTDIIQTDAAINPGNSGGPLLDIYGRVVGINTAIAQDAENVGFALPINAVENTITQVKETGEISSPFLGVRYMILNEDIQKANNLDYDYGALVLRGDQRTDFAVMPGSPADKAGIVENDIILEADGEKITTDNQLTDIIANHNVGDTLTLKIAHRGEEKEVKVTLEKRK